MVIGSEFGLSQAQAVYGLPDGSMLLQSDGRAGLPYNGAIVKLRPDGTPDVTFGTQGKLLIDGSYSRSSIAALPDGGFFLANAFWNTRDRLLVSKRLPDGALDTRWGSGGVVSVPINTSDVGPVMIAPDASLIISAFGSATMIRLRPDGTRDMGYGVANGMAYPQVWSGTWFMDSMMQADGSVIVSFEIVAPGTLPGSATGMALARYLPDGRRDLTFGGAASINGVLRLPEALGQSPADGRLIRRSDGRFYLLTGFQLNSTIYSFNANGSRDATFGDGGVVSHDFGAFADQAEDGVVLADDSLVVASTALRTAGGTNPSDAVLARVMPDGRLDVGFGDRGIARFSAVPADTAQSLLLQPDGSLTLMSVDGSWTGAEPVQTKAWLSRFGGPDATPAAVTLIDGRLTIESGDAPDVVTLKRAGGRLTIEVNGRRYDMATSGIYEVVIDAGDGDDHISVDAIGGGIRVEGGAGQDVLTLVTHAGSTGSIAADELVTGQARITPASIEYVEWRGTPDVDQVAIASLGAARSLNIDLGAGADILTIQPTAIDSATGTARFAGDASDRVIVRLGANAGAITLGERSVAVAGVGLISTSAAHRFDLIGSTGDDAFHIRAWAGLSATLTGGDGGDRLVVEQFGQAAASIVEGSVAGSGIARLDAAMADVVAFASVESAIVIGDATPPRAVLTEFESELRLAVTIELTERIDPTSFDATRIRVEEIGTGRQLDNAVASIAIEPNASNGDRVIVGLSPRDLVAGTFRVTLLPGVLGDTGGVPTDAPIATTFAYMPADANGNGLADFSDLLVLAKNLGRSVAGRSNGDFDFDGDVDFDDLLMLARNFAAPTAETSPAATTKSAARKRVAVNADLA